MKKVKKISFECACSQRKICFYSVSVNSLKIGKNIREISCYDSNANLENCPSPHQKMEVPIFFDGKNAWVINSKKSIFQTENIISTITIYL